MLAAGVTMVAGGALAATVSGPYDVKNTHLIGSPYHRTAEITAATCEIVWSMGPTLLIRIDTIDGRTLVAGYVLGDALGLMIFLIQDDGTLDGHWTIAGQPRADTEVLAQQ